MNLVNKALQIASDGHEGQFRRDCVTLYISHPMTVRQIAVKWIKEQDRPRIVTFFRAIQSIFCKDESMELVEIVALLHDLVEDQQQKGYTFEFILSELQKEDNNKHSNDFFRFLEKNLRSVTHENKDSYLDYLLKIRYNPLSTIIKLADLEHNLSTLDNPKKDKHKIDKYQMAQYILLH